MTDRNRALAVAVVSAKGQTQQAKAANRVKAEANHPAKALEESWQEFVGNAYGRMPGIKWGKPERDLARKFVLEVANLEEAIADIRYFVNAWTKKGQFPQFRTFWMVRGQIHAEVVGMLKPATSKRAMAEYDPEESDQVTRGGWGK